MHALSVQVCDDSQRQLLMTRITIFLNQLKKLTYGKHIVARVEKLLVAGNAAAAVQQVTLPLLLLFDAVRRCLMHALVCIKQAHLLCSQLSSRSHCPCPCFALIFAAAAIQQVTLPLPCPCWSMLLLFDALS